MTEVLENMGLDALLANIHQDSAEEMDIRLRKILSLLAEGKQDLVSVDFLMRSLPNWQDAIKALDSAIVTRLWIACLIVLGTRPKNPMIII